MGMTKVDISQFLQQTEPDSTTSTMPTDEWVPQHLWQWKETAALAPEYLFKDLIPADSKILFSGKAKRAFKSWMAYTIALSAATGKTVGPLEPVNSEGVPVLAFSQEGGKAQNFNRFCWLEKGFGIDATAIKNFRFCFKDPILLDDPEWVYRVKRFVDREGVKLVILDPLVMLMRGDENKVNEVAKVMRSINEIGASGATVLFVHHLNKNQFNPKDGNRDIDDEIRGTSALAGFYDQHWAFRTRREEQKYNELTIRSKDDEEKKAEVRWFIDKPNGVATFKLDWVTEEIVKAKTVRAIYDEMIPTQEYTQKVIAGMAELAYEDAVPLIKDMLAAGMLEAKGKLYVCRVIDKSVD